jgi:hypothetical protein
MKKNWLLWGAVAIGAYLIYKRMKNNTTGREIAPPPTGTKPPVSPRPIGSKPPVSPRPTGTTIEEVTIQEQL